MSVKKCRKCGAVWYTALPNCAFCGIEGEEQPISTHTGRLPEAPAPAAQAEPEEPDAAVAVAEAPPVPPTGSDPDPTPVPETRMDPPPPAPAVEENPASSPIEEKKPDVSILPRPEEH